MCVSIDETVDIEGRPISSFIVGSLVILIVKGVVFLFHDERLEKKKNFFTISKFFNKSTGNIMAKDEHVLLLTISDATPL